MAESKVFCVFLDTAAREYVTSPWYRQNRIMINMQHLVSAEEHYDVGPDHKTVSFLDINLRDGRFFKCFGKLEDLSKVIEGMNK